MFKTYQIKTHKKRHTKLSKKIKWLKIKRINIKNHLHRLLSRSARRHLLVSTKAPPRLECMDNKEAWWVVSWCENEKIKHRWLHYDNSHRHEDYRNKYQPRFKMGRLVPHPQMVDLVVVVGPFLLVLSHSFAPWCQLLCGLNNLFPIIVRRNTPMWAHINNGK